MSRLDVMVSVAGEVMPCELVKSNKKTAWVKLPDGHVIKVRNHQLTWTRGKSYDTGSTLLDSTGRRIRSGDQVDRLHYGGKPRI